MAEGSQEAIVWGRGECQNVDAWRGGGFGHIDGAITRGGFWKGEDRDLKESLGCHILCTLTRKEL